MTLLFGVISMNSQCKKGKVLFTIENNPVYTSEFLHVYNKNKDVVSEENKKSIEEYLELFVNYKLKLREAYELKLDTIPSYRSEFNKYKNQLIEPFLKDRSVSDRLVKEAYDRMKKEVRARHILVRFSPGAKPSDTLKAYQKIIKARNLVIAGENFESVAEKFSEDKDRAGKVNNGGDLGYFTAFSMLYPFETAAYTTAIGDVSIPFKTKYGYHIVKVEDVRDSKGEIQVAHIMIADKKTDKSFAKKQIDDIYKKMQQGDEFSFLAKKYSDDKASAVKGGVIRKFSLSKMIQPFANISFNLKNIGDVSEPFQTKFGWHIVKLIKKFPIQDFDVLKEELAKKVAKGERSVLIGKSIVTKLKKKYSYKLKNDVLNKVLDSDNKINIENATVLTIEKENYSTNALKNYLLKNKGKNYKDFVDDRLIDYYKNHLEYEDEDYANTLNEYRDGLLLFDLLQKRIWTKAEKDTIGLQEFFNKNRADYNWKKRATAAIASCTRSEKANLVQKLMSEGKTVNEIKELVNEGATIHVLFHSGDYEIDSRKLPKGFVIKEGVSKVYSDDSKHFSVVNVAAILNSSPKELNDVKGKVISDYQNYLEKQWIKELHNKYKVAIKKRRVKKLIKKYN